jgi:hypothetical protein
MTKYLYQEISYFFPAKRKISSLFNNSIYSGVWFNTLSNLWFALARTEGSTAQITQRLRNLVLNQRTRSPVRGGGYYRTEGPQFPIERASVPNQAALKILRGLILWGPKLVMRGWEKKSRNRPLESNVSSKKQTRCYYA